MKKIVVQRILVVNVNWLGDIIFSAPVFKALKKNYPGAKICCFAVPRVTEVLQCIPEVDEIITYDEKGSGRGLLGKLRVIAEIKKGKFDIAFLLHGSATRALMVYLAGIPVRVGHSTKKRAGLLTHPIPFLGEEHHKSDIYLNVIQSFGLTVEDKTCTIEITKNAKQDIASILAQEGITKQDPFIVVHTSGNWHLKRWPPEYWGQLIQKMNHELNIKVIISEGPNDLEWAKEIARISGVNPIVLAGKTTLHQLLALLERARVVISADSGPLHIASCVNQNVIGLYGPTMPSTTGPRGKANAVIFKKDVGCNRASCYFLACPKNICMDAVSVGEVLEAAKSLMLKVQREEC